MKYLKIVKLDNARNRWKKWRLCKYVINGKNIYFIRYILSYIIWLKLWNGSLGTQQLIIKVFKLVVTFR